MSKVQIQIFAQFTCSSFYSFPTFIVRSYHRELASVRKSRKYIERQQKNKNGNSQRSSCILPIILISSSPPSSSSSDCLSCGRPSAMRRRSKSSWKQFFCYCFSRLGTIHLLLTWAVTVFLETSPSEF